MTRADLRQIFFKSNVMLWAALAVVGCTPSGAPDTSTASASPLAHTSSADGSGTSTEAGPQTGRLAEGMPYAELRSFVLASGWSPKVAANCKTNVVGADFDAICAADPSACAVCDDLPELDACSADGHCLMHFTRGAEGLSVSTYGDLADWNVANPTSRLSVKWWDPETVGAPEDTR